MITKCPLCQGTKEVLSRIPRLMGATYPEDDPYKGDEYLEPCPLCAEELGIGEVNNE